MKGTITNTNTITKKGQDTIFSFFLLQLVKHNKKKKKNYRAVNVSVYCILRPLYVRRSMD